MGIPKEEIAPETGPVTEPRNVASGNARGPGRTGQAAPDASSGAGSLLRSEDPEDWLNQAPGAASNGASWARMRDLTRPRTRGGAAPNRASAPWAGTFQAPTPRGATPPPAAGDPPPRVVPHTPGTPLPLTSVQGDTATVEDEAARQTAPKVFRFKARTEATEIVEGHLTAFSRERAVELLFLRKYTPLEVVEVDPEKALGKRKSRPRRVSRQALAVFTRQMAILYRSGVPLLRALDALSRTEDKALSDVIQDVRKGVYNGFPMSRAMQKHPECFPPEYAAMVEAAELAGTLETVLDRLASNLERQVQLFARVKAVLNYPALVTALAVGINLFIFKWILPQFEPIFASSGVALPFLTAAIMQMVRWTNSPMFWVVAALVPLAAYGGYVVLKRSPRLREPIDHLMLRLPLLGPIYHRLILTEIFSIMFNLYSAGINIQRTLVLASRVANNRIYEKALLSIAERVKEGDSLTSAFRRQKGHFTRLVVQMVNMGESTGKPAMGFRFLTDFYKAELEYILDGLAATLEPLLIGIVGIMTGTVVMAVFLPIYRIVSAMM